MLKCPKKVRQRFKAKRKGLPPAIHRQQALSAAWTIFTSEYCLTFGGHFNGLCDLLFGFTDLLSLMLIFLPLYSKPVDGYIYSVSLIEYVDNEIWIRMTYWGLFIALTIIGIVNILMVNFKFEKGKKVITFLSVGLSIITVLYLAIAREPYAVTVAFLLLLIKGGLLYKRAMAGR